jgi:S1-C subfamily serine protease
MQARHAVVIATALLLVVGAGAGTTGVLAPSLANGSGATQVDGAQPGSAACDYTDLYEQTVGSVVAVRTTTGQGSGFVYRDFDANATSYVVTNAHVVRDASEVTVEFTRGESRRGTVVGRDTYSDLAVVRVDDTPGYAGALSVARSPPEPGAKVAAIGNPLGFGETITQGIVSGLNRTIPAQGGFSIPDVIQTDTAINPGNSGGPLLTCDGTVVGVNTAGIVAVQVENVGFAVSSTLINRVVPSLISTGEFDHAYLGVSVVPISPQIAAANDLNTTRGLYVNRVIEPGPAAGILRGTTGTATVDGVPVPTGGDVIVGIDGRPVASGEDLSSYLVAKASPGDTVPVAVIRDGERQQVNVTLGERPEPLMT